VCTTSFGQQSYSVTDGLCQSFASNYFYQLYAQFHFSSLSNATVSFHALPDCSDFQTGSVFVVNGQCSPWFTLQYRGTITSQQVIASWALPTPPPPPQVGAAGFVAPSFFMALFAVLMAAALSA